MGQRLQTWKPAAWRPEPWKSGDGERLWLSMLVEAMEEVSRPEIRKMPCDPKILTRAPRPANAPGLAISLRCLDLLPAELKSWGPPRPVYSPAICNRGRWPRSMPRNFSSSRVI